MILGLLLLAAHVGGQAAAQQSEQCSIRDCPGKYAPHPIVPSSPEQLEKRRSVVKLISDLQDIIKPNGLEETAIALVQSQEAEWNRKKRAPGVTDAELKAAHERYWDARKTLKLIAQRRDELRPLILKETIDLFGLKPPITDFSKDPRLDERYKAAQPWNPTYSDAEIFDAKTGRYRKRTKDERIEELKEKAKAAKEAGLEASQGLDVSATLPDSRIQVFDDAFTDPESLALYIHHETSHWLTNMYRGGNGSASPEDHYRSEHEAYAQHAAFAAQLGRTSDAKYAGQTSRAYAAQAEAIAGKGLTWLQLRKDSRYDHFLHATLPPNLDSSNPPPPDDIEARRRQGEEHFLDSWKRQTDALKPDLKDAKKRAEEEAAKSEQQKREWAMREAEERRGIRWSRFCIWALYASQYIRGVRYGDSEWGNPKRIEDQARAYRDYLSSNLIVLTDAEIEAGIAKDKGRFTGEVGEAQLRVIRMFQAIPGPVDVDWVMAKLEHERRGGRSGELISNFISAIGKAVADGSAAIVSTITTPFESRKGSGNSGSSGREDSGGRSIDGVYSYRQLRGVAARGW
jgi:hypothetical protein